MVYLICILFDNLFNTILEGNIEGKHAGGPGFVQLVKESENWVVSRGQKEDGQ